MLSAPRPFLSLLSTLVLCAPTSAQSGTPVAVVLAADADVQEELAAREVRRYGYLRTGSLLPLVRCTTPGEMPADLAMGAVVKRMSRDEDDDEKEQKIPEAAHDVMESFRM